MAGASRLLDLDRAGGDERRRGQPGRRLGRDRPTLADRKPVVVVPMTAVAPAAAVPPTAAACPAALAPDEAPARAGAGGVADVQDRELAEQHEPSYSEDGGKSLTRLVELALER